MIVFCGKNVTISMITYNVRGKYYMEFYKILGINSSATHDEIKKAYRTMLKTYRPESNSEEFKRIREAYETLGNEMSRAEYDMMSNFGDEVNELVEKGRKFIEGEEYESAEKCFKKIMMIEPNYALARNLYALTLAYQGQHTKAIPQFKKVIAKNPQNTTYLYNLAISLVEVDEHDEALVHARKAQEIDSESTEFFILESKILENLNRTEDAKKCLESAISKLPQNDFRSFFYLFQLFKIDLMKKNERGMNQLFHRIHDMLNVHDDETEYVSNRFASLAFDLHKRKMYDFAHYATERAIRLTPEAEHIQWLHETVSENKPRFMEYRLLDDDENILQTIKHVYYLLLYADDFEEDEYDELKNTVFQTMEHEIELVPDEYIHSIRKLFVTYPVLYELNAELWKHVNRQAKLHSS
jgi:tetratricopeptide (TPR) repeat protein